MGNSDHGTTYTYTETRFAVDSVDRRRRWGHPTMALHTRTHQRDLDSYVNPMETQAYLTTIVSVNPFQKGFLHTKFTTQFGHVGDSNSKRVCRKLGSRG